MRFSAQGARNASEVHPLVLLSNLAGRHGGELTLERLTEWLAQRTGSRYLRIDPTRVDVAAVTALVSHAYARRHRFLPLAVDAERVLVATSEPLVQEWRRDLQHLTRRRIELAVVNPLDLHRYTMEFYGVTRSVRGARGDVRGEASTTLPSFEQLVELGRTATSMPTTSTSCTSSTGCCSTPTNSAPRTSIWSRVARWAACASASTACCTRCSRCRQR